MNKLAFLRQVPLLDNLTDRELRALSADLVSHCFQRNEIIVRQGDADHTLYLILSGRVRIYMLGEDGHEISFTIMGPGDVFGEMSLIDDLPRSAYAVALEETRVLILSQMACLKHLEQCPQLALNFMRALSDKLRRTSYQAGSLAFLDVYRRVARKLLELAEEHSRPDPEGIRIEAMLTQEELASMVGATRESTNKALGAFRRQGLIALRKGHIIVKNRRALREYLA